MKEGRRRKRRRRRRKRKRRRRKGMDLHFGRRRGNDQSIPEAEPTRKMGKDAETH